MVEWLNYHHLHYFWAVAKEGGLTQAAEVLHLSQPTLSSQISKLEKSLGVKLFDFRQNFANGHERHSVPPGNSV